MKQILKLKLKNHQKSVKDCRSVNNPEFSIPKPISKFKKEESEKEILETFHKVQVNIPLLDAVKQVPRYAKFLKELCTNKRKLRGGERVRVGENIFAVLQKKLL